MEEIIRSAKLIEKKKPTGRVQVSSIVFVSSNGNKEKFQIVEPEETNLQERKISYQSPLGKALFDKSVGAKIKIETPEGKIQYKILKIE